MATKGSTRKRFQNKDPIHGTAKRVIVKKTLQAWIPFNLHMGYRQLYYIDGFSSNGVYQEAEQIAEVPIEKYGSPVIALDCALDCFHNLSELLDKNTREYG